MIALTADVVAHAVIASASHMPGDTIRATDLLERGRYPAAVALALESKRPLVDVCRVLNVEPAAVADARRALEGRFRVAQEAARASIRLNAIAMAPEAAAEPVCVPAPTFQPAAPAKAPAPRRPADPSTRSLRSAVLDQLADAPSTAPSLAILCDAKELAVSEVLRSLEREGVVIALAVPSQGARYRQWSAAHGDAK
jgi:hypothetical protein